MRQYTVILSKLHQQSHDVDVPDSTHTHTQTHTRAHTRMRTQNSTQTDTDTDTQMHACTYTRMHD